MIKNYLKIAYRYLVRNRLYSFINVFGLAIGLSICIIISLWVKQELSYDRFHTKAHRIYRLERELFRDNLYSRWPISSGAYKQALIDDYPEIENAVRLWRREFSIKDHNNFIHRQVLFAADNSVFEMFDFVLEEGSELTALTEPKTVVLTRENAVKYFGSDDVVGRSLSLEWQGEPTDFKVTGILKEVPENSHVQFDMLMSIASYPDERFANWRSNYLYTYVLAREDTSKATLEERLKSFVDQRLEPHYGDLLAQGLGIHEVLKIHLFSITDIHLHPSPNWELEPGGNIQSVYIFSTIAVFILLIAAINFINLSTARAGKRAREVSLRKTVGAAKSQLRRQFMLESALSALLSLVVACGLCLLLIPAFNHIIAEKLSIGLIFRLQNLVSIIGITLTVGILSGLYPAFYLTRFDPARVLKGGSLSGRGKSAFRQNMVVIQFVISTALIIGMFTVYRQMQYIQTRPLGFEKDNLVVIPARSQQISRGYDSFRSELLQHGQVISVSASSDLPGDPLFGNGSVYNRLESDENINLTLMTSHYDYVDALGLEILAGRGFSWEFSTDTPGTMILNEAAANRIGWTPDEAVGKKLDRGDPETTFQVVGVVKNFHYQSLRREVEPAAVMLFPNLMTMISVRIVPGDLERTLSLIREKWEGAFPGELFEYSFLDSRIHQMYEKERKMQNIFAVFSSLSILVACLGLFGLAAFTAEVKTKEIGIRKTLGASTSSVTYLLSKEFVRWIIIANVVAWPLAWFMMNRWLQDFAYRITMGWSVFLIAGFLTLFIALSTSIFQTLKAAFANPVDSLRYE